MQSLRDKLINAGLVTREQAERLEKRTNRQPTRGPQPETAPSDPRPASRKSESLKQRQLDARLCELARTSEVPIQPGERAFYFQTRKGKLRRLELSEEQSKLLEEGKLAVVERPQPAGIEHSLVPPHVAEEMFQLSAKSVRFFNRPGAPIGCREDEDAGSTKE